MINILAAIVMVLGVMIARLLLKAVLLPFQFVRSLFRRRPAAT